MNRKNEHRPQAAVSRDTVAKRVGEDEPRHQLAQNVPLAKRKAEPVRHERGRQGFALADR
jgi:hypothetical protein